MPPPNMTTFDAPGRETCRVRRERTSTPLQALVLLNDKQYVEDLKRLDERLKLERALSVWTFVLEKKTLESLLKDRAQLTAAPRKPEPAKSK